MTGTVLRMDGGEVKSVWRAAERTTGSAEHRLEASVEERE